MRLKFWWWAHDAAERLWHWIYYNRLPEGIARREHSAKLLNGSYSYIFQWVKHDTTKHEP